MSITYRRNRMFILVLVAATALTSLVVQAEPALAASDTAAEARFIDSVNAERARRGVDRLRVNAELTAVARRHSRDMAGADKLRHNPDLTDEVRNWQRLSENVGYSYSVARLHDALMDSKGHKRNILDPKVTQLGVGVDVRGGKVWVTQLFRLTFESQSVRFTDVPRDLSHRRNIHTLATEGVTLGCGGSRYCPDRSLSRAEMATFLARVTERIPSERDRFRDVGPASSHWGNINAIKASGLTVGCGHQRFCPNARVTRAEMATFLVRAFDL